MTARRFRQFFGPSARHDRACFEMRFPLPDAPVRLARLEPLLAHYEVKLSADLPDAAIPADEAVCRLVRAVLGLRADWWCIHGIDDGEAFVAVAYPNQRVSALVLDTALDLIDVERRVSVALDRKLRALGELVGEGGKVRMPMFRAAQMLGRDGLQVVSSIKLYQVGQGSKGVHFFRMVCERDAITGMKLEQNKHITAEVLRRFGLPATRGVLVTNVGDVRAAIARVGLPCVVKPVEMSQGSGVTTGLEREDAVATAVRHARDLSGQHVLIENHVVGYDHRILVAGDEMLWAYRKVPATVTGDGRSTVRQLIEQENRRRASIRSGTEAYLYPIVFDDAVKRFVAERHGLQTDEVLEDGRRIDLAWQANIARGGVLEDVTGIVHPDVRALAIRASRVFRIRVMGIDFITPDISRSWREVPCAIVEVNRSPGISGIGDASLVHRAMFPNRRSGCIPTIAVIGGDAYRAAAAEAVRRALGGSGMRLATADYRDIAGGPEEVSETSHTRAVETLLIDREADAGLILCEADRIERSGLPLNRCDLVVAEDAARFPWLAGAAGTLVSGAAAPARIAQAVERLLRLYRDPDEGGPLPVLEAAAGAAGDDAFRVTVWRTRPLPRAWFWTQVGLEAPDTGGLITHRDLLAAVHQLADRALREQGAALPAGFVHGDLPGSWVRVTFEATLALPAAQADAARAALLAAIARVNAIAAMRAG